MFVCPKCGRHNFSIRIEFLMHLTKCGKSRRRPPQRKRLKAYKKAADTYDDPFRCLDVKDLCSIEESDTHQDIIEPPESRTSSPITSEQIDVAKGVENVSANISYAYKKAADTYDDPFRCLDVKDLCSIEESDTHQDIIEPPESRTSSPITSEQIDVAKGVENVSANISYAYKKAADTYDDPFRCLDVKDLCSIEESDTHQDIIEPPELRTSSPITSEQIDVAKGVENVSANISYDPVSFELKHTTQCQVIPPHGQDDQEFDQAQEQEKNIKCPSKTKGNWCTLCASMQSKLMRHMIKKHPTAREVKYYLSIQDLDPKVQSKKRKEASKYIINKSNKVFNLSLIDDKTSSNLIPVKKTKTNLTPDSHVLCSDCGGLLSRKYFSQHKESCLKRKLMLGHEQLESPKKQVLDNQFEPLNKKYNVLQKTVLDKMKNDEIFRTVKNDQLILEFGRRFLNSHMADKQKHYVSSKMRTLGDLLLKMKAKYRNISCFEDVVDPTNFDNLCSTVREWSLYDELTGLCKKGSVCRRLCKSLKNVSDILYSQAIKSKTTDTNTMMAIKSKHKRFKSLMQSDWPVEVSAAADKSVKLVKVAKHDKMPLQQDLITFFNSISTEISNTIELLKANIDEKHYNNLVKTTLAYLIAFNSRRPSEVAYATLENYKTLEIKATGADTGTLGVFKVFATKNGVKVPVIVPSNILIAIDCILSFRRVFNVPGNYIFSKTNGLAYNGTTVLSNSKQKVTLQNPDDFTANGLRHYWATVTQLDPNMKAHMPKFLGHTTNTHERFYEMPMSNIHLNIIGPTIIKHCNIEQNLDSNNTTETTSLDQVSASEDNIMEDSPQPKDNIYNLPNQAENKTPTKIKTPKAKHFKHSNKIGIRNENKKPVTSTSNKSSMPSPKVLRKRKIKKQAKEESNSSSPEKLFSDASQDSIYTPSPKKRKKMLHEDASCTASSDSSNTSSIIDTQKRNRWITPEKEELLSGIPDTILGVAPAPRGAIKQLWEESKIIKKRHSLQMTRIEVSKYFTKKKKIPTPIKKKIFPSE